jgi:hypothetical protein
MRARIAGLVAALTIGACARNASAPTSPSTPVDAFGTLNGARIELTAEGGIAALTTTRRVTHDDRTYAFSMRQICGATCAAPMDSASGVLSAAAADSLFSVVWALAPMQLQDDYGTTAGAADMFEYTLRVTFDGTTKTVRADDGTMPSAMRQVAAILAGTIDTARAIAKR